MDPVSIKGAEKDARFPSGPWTGFFWQTMFPGRNPMTLDMVFRDGQLEAQGGDRVGPFTFSGAYDITDGACTWTKQYLGKHQVAYSGVSQGPGIWGAWEITQFWGLYRDRGVFHIWPVGTTPSDDVNLTEKAFLSQGPPRNLIATLIGAAVTAVAYFLIWRLRH
jgi:hypothetical protein